MTRRNTAAGMPAGERYGRRAERRAGITTLVCTLGRQHQTTERPGRLRAAFERELGRLLPVAALRLNELDVAVQVRLGRPMWIDNTVAFDVPVAPGERPVVLEASGGPDVPLDQWTLQTLEAAACLAAFVLEADGARSHRAALAPEPPADGAAPLIGSSRLMRNLRDRIERVAGTDFTVLIEGESGTGKELVARQIHELSRRRRGPFVAINCAALVETLLEAELFGIEERTATGVRGRRGKFEHADGGTLFLDEVSDLSMAAQAKLLRAIQDLTVERVGGELPRRIDTRIVVATNRPLWGLVQQEVFRADLFYRLSGVEIRVPPLRARRDDILELARYFLERHDTRGRFTLTPSALDALVAYDWPGNVRELERLMEGAVATAESHRISLDDLPVSLRGGYGEYLMPSVQRNDTMRAWGSRYARLVMDRCDGNKRRACDWLGISYHTLRAYLEYTPRDGSPAPAAGDDDGGDDSGGLEPGACLPDAASTRAEGLDGLR